MESLKHLSAEAKKLFNSIVEEWDLTPAQLKGLRVSLEALDRAQQCRKRIDQDGLTIPDRFGTPHVHPVLAIERDSRAAFMAGMKQLGLHDDDTEAKKPGRPTSYERHVAGKGW